MASPYSIDANRRSAATQSTAARERETARASIEMRPRPCSCGVLCKTISVSLAANTKLDYLLASIADCSAPLAFLYYGSAARYASVRALFFFCEALYVILLLGCWRCCRCCCMCRRTYYTAKHFLRTDEEIVLAMARRAHKTKPAMRARVSKSRGGRGQENSICQHIMALSHQGNGNEICV